MGNKKKITKKRSFARELESYKEALWKADNNTGSRSRETAAMRTKIYNLLSNAVLEKKPASLKETDVDRIVDFLEIDASYFFNREFDRGVSILTKLTAQSNMRACIVLADIYSCAWFEAPSGYRKISRATLLYEKAVKDKCFGGYANARLAEIEKSFAAGSETSDHRTRARGYAEKSAGEFNSPFGLTLLGCWHYDGTVYDKDWVKAHDYLQRSYEIVKNWNDRRIKWETFYHYSWMLFYGQGCIANPKKARKLMETAAENGYEPAKNWVEQEKNESTEPQNNANSSDTNQSGENEDKSETRTSHGRENTPAATADNPMACFSRKNRRKKGQIKTKKQLDALLRPLNDMIGCKPVKEEIEALVYMAHANALRERKGINTVPLTLHVAFLGSPGTGKTTVARMYAKILHELGFLSKGHLVECSRADLIGEYVGHTAPKVRTMAEKAAGGVLFIDEAYALHHDPDWDFGPEAITELMVQMENRRGDFVVVLAGYTDKMWTFLKVNPGLKSRVPNIVIFPDYKQPEMMEIFEKFVSERKFTVTPAALNLVSDFFRKLDNESLRRFGNARLAREIFEDSLGLQARRIVKKGLRSKKALLTIEAEDIKLPTDPTGKEKSGKNILRIVRDDDKK